ncbi:response regulator transcription factor [Streptomyces inhibens]|uniref:response regulator transcription factor n=1 Tax=Streptomyces inhibens TaxID=2293571 RepID=UPI00367F0C1D
MGGAHGHRTRRRRPRRRRTLQPEIAARMYISRRTVSTHASHILNKLGMTSRVELAAEVIRRKNLDRPPSQD